MSSLTPLTNIPIMRELQKPLEKSMERLKTRMVWMISLSCQEQTAQNKVSICHSQNHHSKLVYNFTYFLVNTVTDAVNGQPEAVNVAQEEEPDERELNDNPFIFSFATAVGEKSFVDFRQHYDHASPPPKYFDDEILLA